MIAIYPGNDERIIKAQKIIWEAVLKQKKPQKQRRLETVYVCWNCGITYGDDEDWEPSRLCPACRKAFQASGKRVIVPEEEE